MVLKGWVTCSSFDAEEKLPCTFPSSMLLTSYLSIMKSTKVWVKFNSSTPLTGISLYKLWEVQHRWGIKEQREETSQPRRKSGKPFLGDFSSPVQKYLGETLLPQRVRVAVTRATKGLCACICSQTSRVFLGPPLSQSDFCLRLLPHVACVEMTSKLLSQQWRRG